jgi:hypothetical protein
MDVEILAIWFAVAIVTAIAAGARGRSPIGWFFIGLLCSFMGLITVLVMRPLRNEIAPETFSPELDETSYRDCPFCAEPIKKAAVKCKHCGSKVKRQTEGFGYEPTKPAWTVAFTLDDDGAYVKMCSQISDLDLPMVLDDDAIRIGPYVNKSDAMQVHKMLANEHGYHGRLENSVAVVPA